MPLPDAAAAIGLALAGAAPFVPLWARAALRARAGETRTALLRGAMEATPCNFAVYDRDRLLVACNESYRALHAEAFRTLRAPIRYDDLMRITVAATTPAERVEAELAARVATHEGTLDRPWDRLYPGGRWMRIDKRRLPGGEVAGFAVDITEIKARETALEASEARYRALVEDAPVGIWHLDAGGRTVFANERLARLFPGGAAPARLAEAGLDDLPEPTDPAHPFGFEPGRETEVRLRWPAGETTLLVAASPWLPGAGGGRPGGAVLTVLDVSALKRARAQLEHLARHDLLTGLGNRGAFSAALESMLRAGRGGALLLGDLDGFKAANDRHGHAAGDALLAAVARRMLGSVRPGDTVCRLGGDEFAVVAPGADGAAAAAIAERLSRAAAGPVAHGGAVLRVGISIGVALAPQHGEDAPALQRAADLALYRVKAGGRGAALLFRPALRAAADARAVLRDALAEALPKGELALHFQPQRDLETHGLVGAEALLRWRSPRLGRDVPPAEALAAAAEARLLSALDAWVLAAAADRLARWEGLAGAPPRLAVNISAASLRDAAFADRVAGALRARGVAPGRLEVEVPEDLAVRDLDAVAGTLGRLRRLGVRLALDDFGGGLSSLLHVVRLPVQLLKLDRSIVAGLGGPTPAARAVLRATVALAGGMGVEVLAEGVETEAQASALRREGCALAQGHLLGRPGPEAALLARAPSAAALGVG